MGLIVADTQQGDRCYRVAARQSANPFRLRILSDTKSDLYTPDILKHQEVFRTMIVNVMEKSFRGLTSRIWYESGC